MWIVTGANGFIGSQMVRELNSRGIDDIVAVDPVTPEERPAPLRNARYKRFLHRDQLRSFLETAEAQDKVEWIVHMGANSSTTEKNWDHLLEVNVRYSEKIFDWCARYRKPLIYASSAATYGGGENGYDDETSADALKPLNLYGESKVAFDRWALRQEAVPANWYGLKFFNVYGPGEAHKGEQASVVSKAFTQIRESGFLNLFKSYHPDYRDGEQKRDFIYVKEITAWMWELTLKKPASGIYNMGTGKARSWLDLARAVFAALQTKEDVRFIPMPGNLQGQYQYFTEAKMKKWARAGMSPSNWTLEDGIQDYVQQHLMKD